MRFLPTNALKVLGLILIILSLFYSIYENAVAKTNAEIAANTAAVTMPHTNNAFDNFVDEPINKALSEQAALMNRGLPKMVDSETRLESVHAANKTFSYTYTLMNIMGSDYERVIAVKKAIEPHLRQRAATSTDFEVFRENGVTLEYDYRGKDGLPLFKVTLTPGNY